MSRIIEKQLELVGKKFGKLTAIEFLGTKDNKGRYLFKWQCDCGNTFIAPHYNITYGKVKGCGCLLYSYVQENVSKNNKLGVLGVSVCYKRKNGKYTYCASIMYDKKEIKKRFRNIDDAIAWRKEQEEIIKREVYGVER